MRRAILSSAHGTAREHGAELVAETVPLDEIAPPNAADTVTGKRIRATAGQPYKKGNAAARDRGPSLVGIRGTTPAEQRRIHRRAKALERKAFREMSVTYAATLSKCPRCHTATVGDDGVCATCRGFGVSTLPTSARVELVSWALATAYSRVAYDRGDAGEGSRLAERASAHRLKAEGYAQREAKARAKHKETGPYDVGAAIAREEAKLSR